MDLRGGDAQRLAGHGWSSNLPLSESQLREAVIETGMRAALGCADWSAQSPTARLALCEERLLLRFGVPDFRPLSAHGQSFLQWLRFREDVTAALFAASGPATVAEPAENETGAATPAVSAARGAVPQWLRDRAVELARQACDISTCPLDEGDLAWRLARQLRVAAPRELEPLAGEALLAARDGGEAGARVGPAACVPAAAVLSGPAPVHTSPGGVAAGEALARAAVRAAPPLVELGAWLRWEATFATALGELGAFLRRASASAGALVFDAGGGHFFKVDADAAAPEDWEAALRLRLPYRAAEALLAAAHACGVRGLAPGIWRVYAECVAARAEADRAAVATFVAELLSALPAPFGGDPVLLRRLLQPLVRPLAQELLEASRGVGRAALHAAGLLLGCPLWAASLQRHLRGGGEEEEAVRPKGGLGARSAAPLPRRRGSRASHAGAPPQEILILDDDEDPPLMATSPIAAGSRVGLKEEAGDGQGSPAAEGAATSAEPVRPTEVHLGAAASEAAGSGHATAPAPPTGDVPEAFPGGVEAARALVDQIRREEFGVGGADSVDIAEPWAQIRERQNDRLARALARLGEHLYADACHWQLELLQNADDCVYPPGVEPQIEFCVGPEPEVVVWTNELGLTPADLRAICDIGRSTKVNCAIDGRDTIGEKGLGFKAVFAISDTPRLFSGPVAVGFDANDPSGLGYVLPAWIGEGEASEGRHAGPGTTLRLPLRPALHGRSAELAARLCELPPATLLFLRRVRRIAVTIACCNIGVGSDAFVPDLQLYVKKRGWLFTGVGGPPAEEVILSIACCGGGGGGPLPREERWLLVRHDVLVPPGLVRPGGGTPRTTRLEAALPLLPDEPGSGGGGYDSSRGALPVFAHLPVGQACGFPIAVQGDWALASSREALLEGHPWNDMLLGEFPALLDKLVAACRARGGALARGYLAAVPDTLVAPTPFRLPLVRWVQQLRQEQCLLSASMEWVAPSQALLMGGAEVREILESPHAPFATAPPGMCLAHAEVEGSVPAGILVSLGCERYNARHALQALEAWAPPAQLAEDPPDVQGWWQRFLALLDSLLDNMPSEEAILLPAFRRLAFIPVVGGGVVACSDRPHLPPEVGAAAVPQPLLAAMRVVCPALLEARVIDLTEARDGDGGGDGGGSPPPPQGGGSGDLLAARVRRLLRRLGVAAVTLRAIFTDLAMPAFSRAARAAAAAGSPLPAVVQAAEVKQPPEVLRALAHLLVRHWDELRAELKEGSPVAWPVAEAGSGKALVAVGVPGKTPPFHLPSARLLEVLGGTPVAPQLPLMPRGKAAQEAAKEVLRRAGLALPVLRVRADDLGDWCCPEFERLIFAALSQSPSGRPSAAVTEQFRSLALAFDDNWCDYEQFVHRSGADGGPEALSSFAHALRTQPWMPSADGSLRRPLELCLPSAAVLAAFPGGAADDLQSCAVPLSSQPFCHALGLQTEPSATLALELLRTWARRGAAGVAPAGAAAAYALVEAEGAEGALLGQPCVVVAVGEPLLAPADCVWEDEADCAGPGLRPLAPLYGPRWRRFFVEALGVAARPSLEQCAAALERLARASSGQLPPALGDCGASGDSAAGYTFALHRMLLNISECASSGAWTSEEVGKVLHERRVFPLVSGGLGAPADGLFWRDDCPDAPAEFFDGALRDALVVQPVEAQLSEGGRAWRLLLDAVGIFAVSAACRFSASCFASTEDAGLTRRARALLPLVERYLWGKHPELHADLAPRAPYLSTLKVDTAAEVFVECTLVGAKPVLWQRQVAVSDQPGDGDLRMFLRTGSQARWPSIASAIARAAVPPGPDPRAMAREGLTTFLLGVQALDHKAADLADLCATLHLPPVPPSEAWVLRPGAAARPASEPASSSVGRRSAPLLAEQEGAMPALVDPYGGAALGPSEQLQVEADALQPRPSRHPLASRVWSGAGRRPGGPPAPPGLGSEPAPKRPRQSWLPSRESWRGQQAGQEPMGAVVNDKTEQVLVGSVVDLSAAGLPQLLLAQPALAPEVVEAVGLGGPAGKAAAEAVGRWGERFVYAYLCRVFGRGARAQTLRRVRWLNEKQESGQQYDIVVEDAAGEPLAFVEVKTTRSLGRRLFEVSHAEWAFAKEAGSRYAIYRVFGAGLPEVALAIVPDPHRQWQEHKIGVCIGL